MEEKQQQTVNEGDGSLKLVVIDLNKTFYNKSSKEEFYKFILSKEPKRLKFIFELAYFKLLDKLNQIRLTEFKENFFNYLDKLPPDQVEAYATEYWQQEYPQHFNKELKNRLDTLKEKGYKIICATGGLELYVKPLFRLYPIDGLVGTQVNYTGKTYLVEGEACSGEEKLRRINKLLEGKKYTIVEAYSDKLEAILKKAQKGYLVKDGIISPAEEEK